MQSTHLKFPFAASAKVCGCDSQISGDFLLLLQKLYHQNELNNQKAHRAVKRKQKSNNPVILSSQAIDVKGVQIWLNEAVQLLQSFRVEQSSSPYGYFSLLTLSAAKEDTIILGGSEEIK